MLELLKIFYFENKFELANIANGDDLEEIKTYTEFIKVKNLQEVKQNIYFSPEYEYSREFLVYFNNKFYLHVKGAPIVFKKELDLENIYFTINSIIIGRGYGLEEVYHSNKRNIYRKMNKILIFTINFELNTVEEETKIIPIEKEEKIYEKIFEFDFVKKYKEEYLIVSPKMIKIKNILKCHNCFKKVKTKNFKKLLESIKNNQDFFDLTC